MILTTDFHCTTTGSHILLGEIWQCICLFCGLAFTRQIALLFNINIKTEYILIARPNSALYFTAGMKNIFLHKKVSICLQGILDVINEPDTSFLDCKHKHMMKSGALSDKFGVLPRLFPIEFHSFTSISDFY